MRKIVFGIAAATAAVSALPAAAIAQPGYYGRGSAYSPYDTNRDGVVDRRENRAAVRDQGYGYGGGYGSFSPYDTNRDGRVDARENRAAQRDQQRYSGYYGNSYGGGYYAPSYSGRYSSYYDRSGYYSGPTWRGSNGRYYCRRSDGSTGTIVGGAAGAVIGSQVAGRGDQALGAILGGAIGAIIGNSVDRNNNRYRCN